MGSGFVLICDGDRLLTELLQHRLGRRGYETAVAHDGSEALALLAQRPPDAVILETILRIHDGHEVLRHIRADGRLRDLPVIMLSARRQDRDIVDALELGASDYVTKPFIPDELVARLARLIKSPPRMKRAAVALSSVMLACGVPAVAQTAEQDYQAGVAARQAGDPEAALLRLRRALEAEPGNADIHLQIGLSLLAIGRLDDAEVAFRHTLDLAPDYADARLGLARVAQRRGDRAAAFAELDRIAAGNEEAATLRRQIEGAAAAAPWRWRIDMDGSYTRVDEAPDWQSASLLVQHRPGPNTIVAVTVEATHRFDRSDLYGEARIDYRFAPGGNVYVLAGGTPDADHRPEWQIGAGAAVRIHGGPYATIAAARSSPRRLSFGRRPDRDARNRAVSGRARLADGAMDQRLGSLHPQLGLAGQG